MLLSLLYSMEIKIIMMNKWFLFCIATNFFFYEWFVCFFTIMIGIRMKPAIPDWIIEMGLISVTLFSCISTISHQYLTQFTYLNVFWLMWKKFNFFTSELLQTESPTSNLYALQVLCLFHSQYSIGNGYNMCYRRKWTTCFLWFWRWNHNLQSRLFTSSFQST